MNTEPEELTWLSQAGLLISDNWRFGPLYAFLPIVAAFYKKDIPVTLVGLHTDADEVLLFSYDGNDINGDLNTIQLVADCLELIESDLDSLVDLWNKPEDISTEISNPVSDVEGD